MPTDASLPRAPVTGGVVLVVHDEVETHDFLASILSVDGWSVVRVYDQAAARQVMEALNVHGVVVSVDLPDGGGPDLVQAIRDRHPAAVVVTVGRGPASTQAVRAIAAGASRHFWMPLGPAAWRDLCAALRRT